MCVCVVKVPRHHNTILICICSVWLRGKRYVKHYTIPKQHAAHKVWGNKDDDSNDCYCWYRCYRSLLLLLLCLLLLLLQKWIPFRGCERECVYSMAHEKLLSSIQNIFVTNNRWQTKYFSSVINCLKLVYGVVYELVFGAVGIIKSAHKHKFVRTHQHSTSKLCTVCWCAASCYKEYQHENKTMRTCVDSRAVILKYVCCV